MRIRTPYYYKEFKCIDKKCTDSCCAGWEVDIDDASWEYYKSVSGGFGDRLKSVMVNEEGENRFKLGENGRCPFLNDENLCDLYIVIGEDKLCKTCTEHPRYMAEYGDLRELGISLSCPEAARIILSKKEPVTYETENNDEPVPMYSDLDPQKYMMLVMARKEAYAEAGDRDKHITERMKNILLDGIDYQKKLTKRVVNKASHSPYKNKRDTITEWLKHIEKYECINPVWNDMLHMTTDFLENEITDYEKAHKDFEKYYYSKMYEYEQMLVYFLFRYYLNSVYDYDLLSKLKLAVFAVLVCEEFAVAEYASYNKFTFKNQIEVMHCFSRQFEHSDENVAAINKSFRNDTLFDVNQFLEVL